MRFNAPDDLSPFDGGGIHPYAYCAADPINYCDPTGHMFSLAGIEMTEDAYKTLAFEQVMKGEERFSAHMEQVNRNPDNSQLTAADLDVLYTPPGSPAQNSHSPHAAGPSGSIAAHHAAQTPTRSNQIDFVNPPSEHPNIDDSTTGVLQPAPTSPSTPAGGSVESRRFRDWFDRAASNPVALPGSTRSNRHMNVLHSLAIALDSKGLKLADLTGGSKLTLATRLNAPTASVLDARVYNGYWSATHSERRVAFERIARVLGSELPSQ